MVHLVCLWWCGNMSSPLPNDSCDRLQLPHDPELDKAGLEDGWMDDFYFNSLFSFLLFWSKCHILIFFIKVSICRDLILVLALCSLQSNQILTLRFYCLVLKQNPVHRPSTPCTNTSVQNISGPLNCAQRLAFFVNKEPLITPSSRWHFAIVINELARRDQVNHQNFSLPIIQCNCKTWEPTKST